MKRPGLYLFSPEHEHVLNEFHTGLPAALAQIAEGRRADARARTDAGADARTDAGADARTDASADARAPVDEQDEERDDFWPEPGTFMAMVRPYDVKNGILHVPVQGTLTNKFPYTFEGFITGYEYISKAIQRGVADPEVAGIALDIDSPGGLVTGLFDLADEIYEARGQKPIRAYANEHALSAAYAIASAADTITVGRTGAVGSIGVISMHADMSGALDKAGVKVTFIYAGDRKKDGNPYEPLGEEAQARWQDRIDHTYEIFVSTVARNRELSEEAVRATEADYYTSSESVVNGLADEVGAFDDAVAAFAAQPSKEGIMSTSKTAVETATAPQNGLTQDDLDQARAAGYADGEKAGRTAGRAAERERVTAILDSEEAKTRPASARHVALHTDMDAEGVKALLAGLPEEKQKLTRSTEEEGEPTGKPSKFEQAMSGTPNPDVGAGDEGDGQPQLDRAARAFANAGYSPASQ